MPYTQFLKDRQLYQDPNTHEYYFTLESGESSDKLRSKTSKFLKKFSKTITIRSYLGEHGILIIKLQNPDEKNVATFISKFEKPIQMQTMPPVNPNKRLPVMVKTVLFEDTLSNELFLKPPPNEINNFKNNIKSYFKSKKATVEFEVRKDSVCPKIIVKPSKNTTKEDIKQLFQCVQPEFNTTFVEEETDKNAIVTSHNKTLFINQEGGQLFFKPNSSEELNTLRTTIERFLKNTCKLFVEVTACSSIGLNGIVVVKPLKKTTTDDIKKIFPKQTIDNDSFNIQRCKTYRSVTSRILYIDPQTNEFFFKTQKDESTKSLYSSLKFFFENNGINVKLTMNRNLGDRGIVWIISQNDATAQKIKQLFTSQQEEKKPTMIYQITKRQTISSYILYEDFDKKTLFIEKNNQQEIDAFASSILRFFKTKKLNIRTIRDKKNNIVIIKPYKGTTIESIKKVFRTVQFKKIPEEKKEALQDSPFESITPMLEEPGEIRQEETLDPMWEPLEKTLPPLPFYGIKRKPVNESSTFFSPKKPRIFLDRVINVPQSEKKGDLGQGSTNNRTFK